MSAYRAMIEKLPDWESMTEQEAVAAALAKSRTYVNSERWSLLGVVQTIGTLNMPTLIDYLEGIGMGWTIAQAAGAGLPIGDLEFNQQLRAIGHPLLDQLADAGRRPASPCELAKLAEDPAKIAEGYRAAKLAVLKHEKIVVASHRWNDYNRAIAAWDGDPATEPSL